MKILICGVGALGSNLVRHLVPDLKAVHEISVLDVDLVEKRNVTPGTQWYTMDQVGIPKVEALEYNVYHAFEKEVTPIHANVIEWDLDDYDLVIDCFDNWSARNVTHGQYVKPDVLHIGFSDQFTFEIEWDEWYQVPTNITTGMDICEMPGASAFIGTVASLGSLVVMNYLEKNDKMRVLGGKFQRTFVG